MSRYKKVMVLGLDGLEPKIVAPMLANGELPTLARLAGKGGFSTVATTSPAQTPVAWSTFATGTNPGGHGIFDFISRDPKTYLPDLALNRYEQKSRFLPPKAVNLRRGTPLWDVLAEAGIPSQVLRCPCTYPPDTVKGRMLSGMGVPDLRGGLGTSTFYTTADEVSPRESENVVRLRADADGRIATHLIGPRNPASRTDLTFEITLAPNPSAGTLTVRSSGSPEELVVGLGRWSDWLHVRFKLGMLQSIRGVVRFYLAGLDPLVGLYASPINFAPDAPLYPISSPSDYSEELAGEIGTFATLGMVEDHNGLNNGRFGEEAFLDQCETVWREREAMMLHELDRFREGFFFCLFDTPDRVQHMFWRYREPGHPANRNMAPPPHFVRVIEDQYKRADAAVGKALNFDDDETLVIVLSDHGFNSFRRGVNLNTWLLRNGLLTLRPGVEPGEEAGDLLRSVDWNRTKAYALGLGGIYLNLQGREAEGTVAADDAHALKASIAGALAGLCDPIGGNVGVQSVSTREEVYRGPYADESPDLLVNFAEGYRVSWGSSMGGVSSEVFEDNVKKWSGDHIIDPALVPGVLLMSRPFRQDGPRLLDLAPTILEALGAPKGKAMEGKTLLS